MNASVTEAIERIARVLAGQRLSANAGQRLSANAGGDESSAAEAVESAWRDHVADALAVLKTLREPDQAMAAAGDVAVWQRMVRAAIGEA